MEQIKVGVVGATGYAGSEICRLLYSHPAAQLAAISSVSFEGMALSEVYPAYRQVIDLVCGTQEEVVAKSDVVFAALPHGLSQELGAQCVAEGKAFIDMGADFRLERGRLQSLVRRDLYRPGPPRAGCVRPAGVLPGEDSGKEAYRKPRLLHHRRAPGPGPRFRGGPHRAGGHHRRLQVRRHRGGEKAQPEQPLPGAQRELYRL